MKTFTLPAKIVQAANLFKAKSDARYYLCGIQVTSSSVVSTNGHCMFVWEENTHVDGEFILNVIDKIPAKSVTIEFEINEEGRSVGFCLDGFGRVISSVLVEVVTGKLPDWKKVIPEGSKPTTEVGFDARYMTLLEKAAKLVGDPKYCGAKLTLNGASESLRFDIKGSEYKSTVLVMPMRL